MDKGIQRKPKEFKPQRMVEFEEFQSGGVFCEDLTASVFGENDQAIVAGSVGVARLPYDADLRIEGNSPRVPQ